MSREEILNSLTGVLRELMGDDDFEVSEEMSLVDDLDLDSLEIMELVMQIEDNFSITIGEDKMTEFALVKDVVDYIEQETAK